MTASHLRAAARHLRPILDRLDELGVQLDPGLRAELESGIKHATVLTDWTPPNGGVASAAFDALIAGRDPLADKDVLSAVVAEMLNQRQDAVRSVGLEQLAALTTEHLEEITAALDEAYQTVVAEPMTSAIAVLAEHQITDPETPAPEVLRHGGRVADAWVQIVETKRIHDELLGKLQLLTAGLGQLGNGGVLMYADPGDELDLQEVRALGSSPHPWVVLNAGMTLGLAGRSGQDERQRRAAGLRAKRQRERAAESQRAVNQWFGVGA